MRIRDCFQIIGLKGIGLQVIGSQVIGLYGIGRKSCGLQGMPIQSFSSSSKNIGNKYAQGFSGTEMGPKT